MLIYLNVNDELKEAMDAYYEARIPGGGPRPVYQQELPSLPSEELIRIYKQALKDQRPVMEYFPEEFIKRYNDWKSGKIKH